ncbi:hypothetical protein J7K24_01485 [bacterium]|nr:hypothetical protein [bacterium]
MWLEKFIIENLSLIPLILLGILSFIFFIVFFFRKILPSKEKIEERIYQQANEWEEFLDSLSDEERKDFLLNDSRADVVWEVCKVCKIDASEDEELADKIFSLSNKRIAEIIARRLVTGYVLHKRFWGPLFLIVMPLWFLFFYIFFRWIQLLVLNIGDARYIFVEGWGAFASPIIFFALLFGGGVMEFFVGKSFVSRHFGKSYYHRLYLGGRRNAFLLMAIAGLFIVPIIVLCIFHYIKIAESGIYYSKWLSLKEDYYQWDDISKIYEEKSRLLKTNKYIFYKNRFVIIFIKDGTRIEFDPHLNIDELYGRREKAIDFVIAKSGVELEEKIYNARTKEYTDFKNLDILRKK